MNQVERIADGPGLLELCALLDRDLPTSGEELAQVIADGAKLDLRIVSGTSIAPDALGIAVFGSEGALKQTNDLFDKCVMDDSAECEALRRRAETLGRAIGMVPAKDGGMVCVLALARGLALQWPILAASVVDGEARAVAMLVLSPSRSGESFARAASAAGLSKLEQQLARALLDTETLEDAAQTLGIKRETAKSTIASATKRVNAKSTAELLGVLVDLSCRPLPPQQDDVATAQALLGLTQAEARAAVALTRQGSIKEAARTLGTTPETVKTHQRAIFSKLGVHRSRAFRRLVSEALALNNLASLSEVRPQLAGENRLKLLFRAGRRVAFVDYGPKRGTPVFVGHGDTTGSLLPDALVRALQERGLRPIALQRPGFGLTARAQSGFLRDAAEDMAFVLGTLKADMAHLLMRDGGAAAALAFAQAYPRRVDKAVLQNPRQPNGAAMRGNNPLGALQRYLRLHPALLEPLGEMLRRQSRSDFLKAILRHVCDAVPADRALISDPRVLETLVSDMHGMIALTAAGFVDERRIYSDGWQPQVGNIGGRWTVVSSGGLFATLNRGPWRMLPEAAFRVIEKGGAFVQYTHAEEIAALFSE